MSCRDLAIRLILSAHANFGALKKGCPCGAGGVGKVMCAEAYIENMVIVMCMLNTALPHLRCQNCATVLQCHCHDTTLMDPAEQSLFVSLSCHIGAVCCTLKIHITDIPVQHRHVREASGDYRQSTVRLIHNDMYHKFNTKVTKRTMFSTMEP